MAEMWTESETTVMRQNHGDWHISLQNVPDDKAEQIIENSDVAFSSWYDAINVDADKGYYIGGKNVTLYGVEETYPARIRQRVLIRKMKKRLLLVLMQKSFGELRLEIISP